MVNSRYGSNGLIVDDQVEQLMNAICNRFGRQCKSSQGNVYAPYFHYDSMKRAIKDSDILRKYKAEDVYNKLVEYNEGYGKMLFNYDLRPQRGLKSLLGGTLLHYNKCADKSGFFLPYISPNCSWFNDFVKKSFN